MALGTANQQTDQQDDQQEQLSWKERLKRKALEAKDSLVEAVRSRIQSRTEDVRDEVDSTLKGSKEIAENLIRDLDQKEKADLLKALDSLKKPKDRLYEGNVTKKDFQKARDMMRFLAKSNNLKASDLSKTVYAELKKHTGSGRLNLFSQSENVANLESRANGITAQLLLKDPEITNQAITKLRESLDANYTLNLSEADYTKVAATGSVGGVNLKENPTALIINNLIKPLDKEPLSQEQKDELKRLILEKLCREKKIAITITPRPQSTETGPDSSVQLDGWLDEADAGLTGELVVSEAEKAERKSDYALGEIARIDRQIAQAKERGDQRSVTVMERTMKTYEAMLTENGRTKLEQQRNAPTPTAPESPDEEEIVGYLGGEVAPERGVVMDEWLDEADAGLTGETVISEAEKAERQSDYALKEIARIDRQIAQAKERGDQRSIIIMERNRKTYEAMLTENGQAKRAEQKQEVVGYLGGDSAEGNEELVGYLGGQTADEQEEMVGYLGGAEESSDNSAALAGQLDGVQGYLGGKEGQDDDEMIVLGEGFEDVQSTEDIKDAIRSDLAQPVGYLGGAEGASDGSTDIAGQLDEATVGNLPGKPAGEQVAGHLPEESDELYVLADDEGNPLPVEEEQDDDEMIVLGEGFEDLETTDDIKHALAEDLGKSTKISDLREASGKPEESREEKAAQEKTRLLALRDETIAAKKEETDSSVRQFMSTESRLYKKLSSWSSKEKKHDSIEKRSGERAVREILDIVENMSKAAVAIKPAAEKYLNLTPEEQDEQDRLQLMQKRVEEKLMKAMREEAAPILAKIMEKSGLKLSQINLKRYKINKKLRDVLTDAVKKQSQKTDRLAA